MFIGSSIDKSPTIALAAGAKIEGGAGKAVKFDGNGDVILCSTAGEAAIGFLILQTADVVEQGDSVTVQTCARGQLAAGGTFAAGDFLAVDANAKLVKAAVTNYVVGQALSAGTAGGFAQDGDEPHGEHDRKEHRKDAARAAGKLIDKQSSENHGVNRRAGS